LEIAARLRILEIGGLQRIITAFQAGNAVIASEKSGGCAIPHVLFSLTLGKIAQEKTRTYHAEMVV